MNKTYIQKLMQVDQLLEEELNKQLKKGNYKQFFLCLIMIGEAKCGGKTQMAQATGLSRQTIYNAMKYCNPRFKTFNALLNVIGFRFEVKAK